jgi:hypothetical protein
MQAREHGTRAAEALAGNVAPVSDTASLAAVTSLPRVASSPAMLSPKRIEYVSVAAGAAAHGNRIIDVDVADFDPTAELASSSSFYCSYRNKT